MAAVNGELVGFMATAKELSIIDEMQRIHYNESKSETIRMLIDAGAEHLGIKPTEKEQ